MSLESELQKELSSRKAINRYRSRRVALSPSGVRMRVEGETKELIAFCSNDYLGLAQHPKVIEAFTQAARHYGVGSGASHLVNGHSQEHHQLEEELAAFTGRPRALLFSTGYMANMGVINGLLGRGDAVFQDKLNHASLLDGGLLSGAKFHRFRHNDCEHLNTQLEKSTAARKLIVVDGVFSMDGDAANLNQLAASAKKHNAWLMVDDAHGFGCLGENGKGVVDACGLALDDVPILMGTLGKAFGTFGAFVAGSETVIEALIQLALTYVYTTALPPAVAAATRASLHLLQTEHWRREKLNALIQQFRRGCEALNLQLMPSQSPIQPIVLGEDAVALNVSKKMAERGFWITAIRPPTVPEGTARLRITLSAEHSEQDVEQLLNALAEVMREVSGELQSE